MSLNKELLRASFELVASRQPEITPRFYEILFERYPSVKPMFGARAQGAQAKMLQEALVAVLDHLEDADWLTSTLHGMGAKHATYGVTEVMYGYVGECLLATLAEHAGADWSPEIERAWTDAYGAIAGLMIEGAAKA